MSGTIPLFPLYASIVWTRKTLLFSLTNSNMEKVSSHPAKGTCLTVPVGLTYQYRFYRLGIIHTGFHAFMVCAGKLGVFWALALLVR